jgi:hypothetical protein
LCRRTVCDAYNMKMNTKWHAILRKFGERDYHYMQDTQIPVDETYIWEERKCVQDIPLERWFSNISLVSAIHCNAGIWLEQKLDGYQVYQLRTRQELVIGQIFRDQIVTVTMNVFNFEKLLLLINSRDRQKVSIYMGRRPVLQYNMVTPPLKVPVVKVCMQMDEPRLDKIQTFLGEGDKIFEHETQKVHYHFYSRASPVEVSIPIEVKFAWFQRTTTVGDSTSFLSLQYYQENNQQYARWSYQNHQDQLSQIIKMIPPNSVVVAPGDGIGLVASLWPGSVSGDKVYETEKVQKESFLQTMVRGKRLADNPVLILSYVTSLMTEIELYSAQHWKGLVFWIDSHDLCPFSGLEHHAHGFYSTVAKTIDYIPLDVQGNHQYSRYTENLLSLKEISFLEVENEATKYWTQMRPLAPPPIKWKRGELLPVVVTTLRTWFLCVDRGVLNIYFAPLGQMIGQVTNVRLVGQNVLSFKQIYQIPIQHSYVGKMKDSLQYYESKDTFLFFSPVPSPKLITFMDQGETVTIKFVEKERVIPLVHVVAQGYDRRIVLLHTIYGLKELLVTSTFHWMVLWKYLEQYAELGWEKKLQQVQGMNPEYLQSYEDDWENKKMGHPTPYKMPTYWKGIVFDTLFEDWERKSIGLKDQGLGGFNPYGNGQHAQPNPQAPFIMQLIHFARDNQFDFEMFSKRTPTYCEVRIQALDRLWVGRGKTKEEACEQISRVVIDDCYFLLPNCKKTCLADNTAMKI